MINNNCKIVPVVNKNGVPLMPTIPSRAKKLIASGAATPFYVLNLFCIRLNIDNYTESEIQKIAVACDPGSKKEAFTVKSYTHTYLNLQCDAVSWVKENIARKSTNRRSRRQRNTPCRQPRFNNRGNSKRQNRIPPSTKARWDLKIEILKKLKTIFPISFCIWEDIKAKTIKGKHKKNKSFSPLEVGKKYFEIEVKKIFPKISFISGRETAELRKHYGLEKDKKNKLSSKFNAHAVDTFAMASSIVGHKDTTMNGNLIPDNTNVVCISPIKYLASYNSGRRQTHMQAIKVDRKKVKLNKLILDKWRSGKYKTKKELFNELKDKIKISQSTFNEIINGKKLHTTGIRRIKRGGTRFSGFTKGSIVKLINPNILKKEKSRLFIVTGSGLEKNQVSLSTFSGKRVSQSININDIKFICYNRFYFIDNENNK